MKHWATNQRTLFSPFQKHVMGYQKMMPNFLLHFSIQTNHIVKKDVSYRTPYFLAWLSRSSSRKTSSQSFLVEQIMSRTNLIGWKWNVFLCIWFQLQNLGNSGTTDFYHYGNDYLYMHFVYLLIAHFNIHMLWLVYSINWRIFCAY